MGIIATLSHGINLVKHAARDISTGGKRSSRWPTVEKHFLQSSPTCAACNGTVRLNVHHVMPFHLDPAMELDPTNLITLCMGPKECHLLIGHAGSFRAYNKNVRADVYQVLTRPETWDEVVVRAKANRLF